MEHSHAEDWKNKRGRKGTNKERKERERTIENGGGRFNTNVLAAKLPPPPITYSWTVPLILDHSYLVGKATSSKVADTKVSGFWRFFKAFESAILDFVKFPTRYECPILGALSNDR